MIAIKKDDYGTHQFLGLVYSKKGMMREALQEEYTALRINPASEIANYIIGRIYRDMGNKEKAMFYYEEALRINPYFVLAHNSLGRLYAEENNLPKAIGEWSLALKIEPDNTQVINNMKIAEEKLRSGYNQEK
jgi:tetratricopeptide (TPR) repeat protein